MNSRSLGEATVSGIRWLAVMRVFSEALSLGSAVVLARLVSPAEFGRAAVALIFVQVGVMLSFEGSASALVQRPSVEEADRRAAMLLSVIIGTVLSVVVYALAGPVWRPLFGSRTAGLIQLVSPAMLILALGSVSRAMVWRRLDFRATSTIDVASVFVGAVVAVALAVAGLGAKAVVIGGIAQSIATTLLLIASSPPPRPAWSRRSQREIAAFGVPAAFTALVGTLFNNIDYAILAARLPAAQAGYYYRAFNVGVVYQDKLSRIMTQIAFPVYSRTSDREQIRRLHERVARLHAVVIFPLLASLMALAPMLVPLVFGPVWKPAVVPTQILAVAGMIAAILTGYPQLMLAIGRPRSLLFFLIGVLIVYATAVTAASGHGLVVVCVVVASVYILVLVGAYRFLLQRYVGISIRRLLPELGPAIVGCLALLAVTVPLAHLLGPLLPRVLTVGISGATGLLVYALVVRGVFPAAWGDLRQLIVRLVPAAGRIGRRPTGPAPVPAP